MDYAAALASVMSWLDAGMPRIPDTAMGRGIALATEWDRERWKNALMRENRPALVGEGEAVMDLVLTQVLIIGPHLVAYAIELERLRERDALPDPSS